MRLPKVRVELEQDLSAPRVEGAFVHVRRVRLRNQWEHERSDSYVYDVVERRLTDAVVIVLFSEDAAGRQVCLRSCLRPPLAFRHELTTPIPDDDPPLLWEVPAGLVEDDERGEAGLRRCAAREALEETGCVVTPDSFEFLGQPVYLSPGVLAEKLYFLAARVDPSQQGVPTEDGSPLEANAAVIFVPMADAIGAIDEGVIQDAKTEVALRRLVLYAGRP